MDIIISQNQKAHYCHVKSFQAKDHVAKCIRPGLFYGLRKFFRRVTMASDGDYLCLTYLTSKNSLDRDRHRQVMKHFYTIHPLSKFGTFLELYYFILFSTSMMIYPAGSSTINWNLNRLKTFWDVAFFLHMITQFYTGFIDKNEKIIIIDRKTIKKKYLRIFPLDVLSSLPLPLFYSYFNPTDYKHLKWIYMLPILKIFRYPYYNYCLQNLCVRYRICYDYQIIFKAAFIYCAAVAWMAGFTLVVGQIDPYFVKWKVDPHGDFHQYIRALQIACQSFPSMSDDPYEKYEMTTMVAIIIHYTVAELRMLVVFGTTLYCTLGFTSCIAAYYKLMDEINLYCHQVGLSKRLTQKINTFFEFKFQESYYNQAAIDACLTYNLRKEIKIYTAISHVYKVGLFRMLPRVVVEKILLLCKNDVYLANDKVNLYEGTKCFIIILGTVAVFTQNGVEVCHLQDGDHFGELHILLNQKGLLPIVIAVSSCHMLILRQRDFDNILKEYPQVRTLLRREALYFWRQAIHVMFEKNIDIILPMRYVRDYLSTYETMKKFEEDRNSYTMFGCAESEDNLRASGQASFTPHPPQVFKGSMDLPDPEVMSKRKFSFSDGIKENEDPDFFDDKQWSGRALSTASKRTYLSDDSKTIGEDEENELFPMNTLQDKNTTPHAEKHVPGRILKREDPKLDAETNRNKSRSASSSQSGKERKSQQTNKNITKSQKKDKK